MTTLTRSIYRSLVRATSPRAAAVIDGQFGAITTTVEGVAEPVVEAAAEAVLEAMGIALTPTAVKTTNQTAAFGQLVVFNATAGALTCTAPNPAGAAGQSWGYYLETTASAHSITGEPHATETFDGNATGAVITVAGTLRVYTSDGTNWLLTQQV